MNSFTAVMLALAALAALIAFFAMRKGRLDTAAGKGHGRTGNKPNSSSPAPARKIAATISALDLKEMLAGSLEPVAVLFFSKRCPACSTMEPLFQEAANQTSMRFVRIDVEENRSTTRRLRMKRIPTLSVFRGTDQQPLDSHVGVLNPDEIIAFVNAAVAKAK